MSRQNVWAFSFDYSLNCTLYILYLPGPGIEPRPKYMKGKFTTILSCIPGGAANEALTE